MSKSGGRELLGVDGGEPPPEGTIDLSRGIPDFPMADHIQSAAQEAIDHGYDSGYTPIEGHRSLRKAIIDKYSPDSDFGPENVLVTTGSSEALFLAFAAHVDVGEEVIIPDPGFDFYQSFAELVDGIPKGVELRTDHTLAPTTVEEAITEDTAAFVVNTPGNPTGAVQSKSDVQDFARIAAEYDVLCISDEAYEPIVFDGEHRSPIEFDSESVAVASTCSKRYVMPGWRVGWIIAERERINQMHKVHRRIQICVNGPGQYVAEAALTGPQSNVEQLISAVRSRRDVLLDGLEDIGLKTQTPQGAFFAWSEVPPGWVEEAVDRGVLVMPGEAYGENGRGHARISYTPKVEVIKKAIERLRSATKAVE